MKVKGATIPDAIVQRVIAYRGAEHRFGPPVEVVSFPAERGRLVVKARGVRSPAGRAGSAGAAEEIADGRRFRRHTSS